MHRQILGTLVLAAVSLCSAHGLAAASPKYLLQADLSGGQSATVSVNLELGGDKLVREGSEVKKLPLSVEGAFNYEEQVIAWSADAADLARSLRKYKSALATLKGEDQGIERRLPDYATTVIAEIRAGQGTMTGADGPLTRDQFDLINVHGNSLAIDRLLPGRELAEGESWEHDGSAVRALLGMDHVAVCEVSSVVTGCAHRQVQIRMAGTVHGTIDGAATEIELRGAYLFHQQHQRITKFNLAIKEKRSVNEVVPGLEAVAKVRLTVKPSSGAGVFGEELVKQAGNLATPLKRELLYDATPKGYQFLHDMAWYITAEQSDLVALHCLQDGNLSAHCNVTTLPPRSAGRETSLEQFELDVRKSLGDNLETVSASTQWTTPSGHNCLGIVANGKVEGLPIQWRYYLVAEDDLPRVSVAVTVEQSLLKQFGDADRQLIDSLRLVSKPIAETATAKSRSNSQ